VAGDRVHPEPGSGSLRPAPGTVGRAAASRDARPTPPSGAQLRDAYGTGIPDLIGPDLAVLFCGINPGLYSGATGLHFARPGNRFWPALHGSGFTPRLLAPHEQHILPSLGLGITNLVPRATARADELTPAELREAPSRLAALIRATNARYLAVVGITAYRTAFRQPKAQLGPQPEPLAGATRWVLPNPSGLNASYQLDRLTAEFARLHTAVNIAAS
jgi:double-stranded uracil-DNA glycosylase